MLTDSAHQFYEGIRLAPGRLQLFRIQVELVPVMAVSQVKTDMVWRIAAVCQIIKIPSRMGRIIWEWQT